MTVKVNEKGRAHAQSLIDAGKVDKSSPWTFTAEDGNKILGPNKDWDAYSAWHLAVDDAEAVNTEAHYKYPFGKDGKVYRSALVAIRQRAGQQGATDVFDAAGELLKKIDGDGDAKDTDSSALGPYRFSATLRGAPWALRLEAMDAVCEAAGAWINEPNSRSMNQSGRTGAIAVLPLRGVLTQGGWSDGGDTSTEAFGAILAEAVADDTVGAILLDINSPGGSVYGTSELADAVFTARKAKPVIGIANSLAASAAYWIGSQCSEFYCTPGGEVGSIGVYTAHADISGALARMGVNVTLISAGKYKTEGNPFGPLDDEARASIQGSVDGYYASFTQAVARGRNAAIASVRDGMGQGRVLSASGAHAAGMVDGVATRATVIRGLARKLKGAQGNVAECAERPEPQVSRLKRAMRELSILG